MRQLGLGVGLSVLVAGGAMATSITENGTASGGRSAQAIFTLTGSSLEIQLINNGVAAANATQLLMGVFWNNQAGVTLAPVVGSVTTPNGMLLGNNMAGSFGAGWAYTAGLTGPIPGGAGIQGAGYSNGGGKQGNGNFFTPAAKLGGGDYGIADGLANNYNPSVQTPIANQEADFFLTVSGNLDLNALGNSLVFTWGTSLDEGQGGPGVPDGGSAVALLGMGLCTVGWLTRQQRA